jgi:hypothetical protein
MHDEDDEEKNRNGRLALVALDYIPVRPRVCSSQRAATTHRSSCGKYILWEGAGLHAGERSIKQVTAPSGPGKDPSYSATGMNVHPSGRTLILGNTGEAQRSISKLAKDNEGP